MRLESVGAEVGLGSLNLGVELSGVCVQGRMERSIRGQIEPRLKRMWELVNAPTLKLAVFEHAEGDLFRVLGLYEERHPRLVSDYRKVYSLVRQQLDQRVSQPDYIRNIFDKDGK